MKCILKKISSIHNNLRTNHVEGETENLPTIGQDFYIFGEALANGYMGRMVRTTPVQTLEAIPNGYKFTTENSTYELEVLESND